MTSGVTESQRTQNASAIRLRLDALAENVMLVRQALEGAARGVGASTAVIDDLKLGVTEACSNVVKYAYRGSSGVLEVSFVHSEGGFTVIISDDGRWLERSGDAEQAGGLGIPLMEAVARSCVIRTDEQGTSVRLEFGLEREQPSDVAGQIDV